jgi:hypothetical protein
MNEGQGKFRHRRLSSKMWTSRGRLPSRQAVAAHGAPRPSSLRFLYRRFSEAPRKSTGLRCTDFAARLAGSLGGHRNVHLRRRTGEGNSAAFDPNVPLSQIIAAGGTSCSPAIGWTKYFRLSRPAASRLTVYLL